MGTKDSPTHAHFKNHIRTAFSRAIIAKALTAINLGRSHNFNNSITYRSRAPDNFSSPSGWGSSQRVFGKIAVQPLGYSRFVFTRIAKMWGKVFIAGRALAVLARASVRARNGLRPTLRVLPTLQFVLIHSRYRSQQSSAA